MVSRWRFLRKFQGDIMQKGKAVGFGTPVPIVGTVPNLPLKGAWHSLGFTRFLMWAAENGVRHIAWTDAAEQMRRYSTGTEGELKRRQLGMQTFYDRQILAEAKKWKKRIGATLGYETIPGPNYVVRPIVREAGVARGWATTDDEGGEWGIYDSNRPNPRPIAVTMTWAQAEEYVARNTDAPTRFRSMTIPQTGIDYIEAGMPTHAKEAYPIVGDVTMEASVGVTPLQVSAMQPLVEALNELVSTTRHKSAGCCECSWRCYKG